MSLVIKDYDEDKLVQHEIIQRHRKTLEKITDERIFTLIEIRGEFVLCEECDGYFCYGLTKEDCEDLSELFSEIANELRK